MNDKRVYYDSYIENNKELKEYVNVHGVDSLVKLLLNMKYGVSQYYFDGLNVELKTVVSLWNNLHKTTANLCGVKCSMLENDEIDCKDFHCLCCPFRRDGGIGAIKKLVDIVEEMNKK